MSEILSIKISAQAAAQIEVAAKWWAENRPAAPDAIADDISEMLAVLAVIDGALVTDFVEWFPGVTTEKTRAVLEHAARSALGSA